MADYLKVARAGAGVDCEHILQTLAGMEVVEVLAGIQNASYACQMALLTDAVASRRRELGRIDDRARYRPPQVFFNRTVATGARNSLFRKHGRGVLVRCAWHMQWAPRMAEHALLTDWPREIRLGNMLVSGRQTVGFAIRVVTDWRLKEMATNQNQKASGVFARSDGVSNPILRDLVSAVRALPETLVVTTNGKPRGRRRECTAGLVAGVRSDLAIAECAYAATSLG